MKSLATLDRGEFRWEFLTPWVDRDLTRTDKVIVCSTFIGLAVVAQELVEPSTALAQHLSYVATFFSYAAGDQVVYRAIAILASLLEIFAYGVEDGAFLLREDAIPEGYNIIFIIVNSYYVLRWALNRSDMVGLGLLDATETELYKRCFEPLGVGAYQYVKLLRDAVWCAPIEETPLTVEGDPVAVDNVLFTALTHNAQPLHLDAEFSKDTEFGKPLVNSIFTLGLMIGVSVQDTTLGTTVGNLGMTDCRFPKPVFHGDTLSVVTTVESLRRSRSREHVGIVGFLHQAHNQHGTEVARCRRQAMMHCRSGQTA